MADFYQRVGAEFYVRDRSAQGVNGFLRNMNRTRREIASIQRTLSTAFGLGVGYLGVRGLVQGFKSVTQAAMEQEKAERQLQAAVGWTNEQRVTATQEAKRYASAMQRLTIYGDEEILSQMAYGRQLGVTTGQLDEATTAAVGLAAKYRLDLSSAMMLVGRASQGQTQMLTRYGIVLDETLTDQEKFEELLRIGAGAFGLAREEAETTAGQLQQYHNLMSDVRERLGGALLPAYRETMKGIATYLATNLDDVGDWAEGTVSIIDSVIQAYGKAQRSFGDWAEKTFGANYIEKAAQERYRLETGEKAAFERTWRGSGWGGYFVQTPPSDPARYESILKQLQAEEQAIQQQRDELIVQRKQLVGQYPAIELPEINLPAGANEIVNNRRLETAETEKATESVRKHFQALQKEQEIIGRLDESRWRAGDYVEMRQAVTQLSDAEAAAMLREIRLRKDLNALSPSQAELMSEYEARLGELRVSEMVNDSMEDLAGTLTDIAFDFENAKKYAADFFETLARNATTELIMQPAVDAWKSAAFDLFQNIFTPTPNQGGGAATVNPDTGYVDPGTGYSTVTGYRLGGVVGYSSGPRYHVPTALFAQAPHMQGGGAISDGGVPIIAHPGERILPAGTQFRVPAPTIHVYNETQTPINRADVGMEVDPHEMIVNIVLRDVATGGPTRAMIQK